MPAGVRRPGRWCGARPARCEGPALRSAEGPGTAAAARSPRLPRFHPPYAGVLAYGGWVLMWQGPGGGAAQ